MLQELRVCEGAEAAVADYDVVEDENADELTGLLEAFGDRAIFRRRLGVSGRVSPREPSSKNSPGEERRPSEESSVRVDYEDDARLSRALTRWQGLHRQWRPPCDGP